MREEGSGQVSRRVRDIGISATIAMANRASTLRSEGRDIISLSLGELDFGTPPHVIEAAHQAALGGATRYTAADGRRSLKQAVQRKFALENDLEFDLDEIHVASGAKQVIHNALAATLDPGDEVVVFAPYWVSYTDLVSFCGGRPVVVPTQPESGFLPDPKRLREAMTPRTRWVILNSPNNPSGAVYDRNLMESLLAVVAAHPRAMVMADEIYEHLVFDGRQHVPALVVAPHLRSRLLTVNGVSKSYAMTGWRIGFAGGPAWLIGAMAKVQSQTAGSSATISQAAAESALTGDQSAIPRWRMALEERRDAALQVLAGSSRLRVHAVPAGAFYLYAEVSACIGRTTPAGRLLASDIEVADYLLDTAGVAVVAGEAFGMSPFIRLSFAVALEQVRDAAKRIAAALEALGAVEEVSAR